MRDTRTRRRLAAARTPNASRRRLEFSLAGSMLLHLLVLLAILLWMMEPKPSEPRASNPVTVVFEPNPLAGAPVKVTEPARSQPSGQPEEPSEPVAPQAPPTPPMPTPPMPAPPLPTPIPPLQPPPVPENAPPRPAQPRLAPPRAERAVPASPPGSSFPAPMNFSFGGAKPAPPRPRMTGPANTIDPTLGPETLGATGPPPTDVGRSDPSIRVTGAQVGTDWITQLHTWWREHGYYPEQAARNGEDGTVRIHVVVDRYGRVESVELVGKSGSQWLDMGAQATFRGAKLPPFPPSTPEPRADLDLTIRYYLIRR